MIIKQNSQIKFLSLWFLIVVIAVACASDQNPSPAQGAGLITPTRTLPDALTLAMPGMETTEAVPTLTLAAPTLQTGTTGYPVPSSVPPTNTPMPDGTTCFVNRIAGYTLQIPSGWYISEPWDSTSYNIFANYDSSLRGSEGDFLPGEQKISIMAFPLEEGMSFEQWVEEHRNQETLSGPVSIELSEPTAYTLGNYSGVAYTSSGYGEFSHINLLGDGKAIAIALLPSASSAQSEALDFLATLDATGSETCN